MLAESRKDPEYEVLASLEKEAKKWKILTRDEEQELITAYKTGKAFSRERTYALDRIIKCNLKLVFKHAKGQNTGTLTTYDLIIEGINGLIHALDKYDQNRLTDKGKPMKLSTYATWWIKQYIQRAKQDKDRTIRIPIHMHDLLSKIKKAHGEYCSTHPDSLGPTPLILSLKTGIPIEQVKTLGTYLFPIGSIDDQLNSDDDSPTISDHLEAPLNRNADYGAEGNSNKEELHKLLRQLPEEDYIFMALKLGIVDGVDRNDKELASALGIKPREVMAIDKRITEYLKTIAVREKFSL